MKNNPPIFFNLSKFDYASMTEHLQHLSEEYSFLRYSYLGESILGKGIPLVSFGSGKRSFIYVAAHHGMEWITSAVLCRFLQELCQAYARSTKPYRLSLAALFQSCTLYFVPMLNPDGVEYQIHGIDQSNPLYERVLAMNDQSNDFSHWQANARGVDLNHNYDAGFWKYKELEAKHKIENGAPTRYSGERPESEPEVLALCNLIRFQESLKGVLTLHTQGEEIFYKSQGITLPKAEAVAKKIAGICRYQLSTAEGLASYGGLTDWCIQILKIPSFTLECGKGTNPLPLEDFPSIYASLRKALFMFPTLL